MLKEAKRIFAFLYLQSTKTESGTFQFIIRFLRITVVWFEGIYSKSYVYQTYELWHVRVLYLALRYARYLKVEGYWIFDISTRTLGQDFKNAVSVIQQCQKPKVEKVLMRILHSILERLLLLKRDDEWSDHCRELGPERLRA
jgi:hypothetical protein